MFAIMFWNLVSQTVPTIGNWIKNNPVKSMWLGGFLGSPLFKTKSNEATTRTRLSKVDEGVQTLNAKAG